LKTGATSTERPVTAPLFTSEFGLLTLSHFLSALGYATLILLPLYLDHLGADRETIGTITALSAVTGLLFRPLAAWSLDVLGRKKTLYWGTFLLVAVMTALYGVTDLGWLIYTDRLVYGLAMAALFPGYFALASDIVPMSRRTEGLALFGIAGLAPLTLNAFVHDLGVNAAELRYFFPAVGGVIALSALFIIPIEERPGHHTDKAYSWREAISALSARPLWPTWLATIVFAGLVATCMAFATVVGAKRGIDNPASMWLVYAAGAATVRVVGSRLPDRVGTHNLVAPALGVYILGVLIIASAWDKTTFLLGATLAGFGHGYSFPVLSSQTVTRAPAAFSGAALALFTALWDIASLVFTPLLGIIADSAGDAVMLATAGLGAMLGLVGWALLEARALSPSPEPASPSGAHTPPAAGPD